jgi:two-component system sensor histidine kinase RpfC
VHAEPNAPVRSLRILLADDNSISQRLAARILERAGHEIVIVENEEQALDALERLSFDLALIDIDRPSISGIEAIKTYRFVSLGQQRVPIMGLTVNATPQAAQRCAEAGMEACLAKPVESARLLAVIQQVVSDAESRSPNCPDNF